MPEVSNLAAPAISRLPNWLDLSDVEHVHVTRGSLNFHLTRPKVGSWAKVAKGMRRASTELQLLSIAEVVDAIDRAAQLWCDRDWPHRRYARDLAVAATGMSAETVDRSFDVELGNYRADSLWDALRREFGDPRVLDEPRNVPHLPGRTMAVGPTLICEIVTGNVPGLPALGLVRALLVKSAIVMKVASGEPTFASLFTDTLAQVQPRFGDAVMVTYWERTDQATRDSVLAEADVVVAYGSDEACASLHGATQAGKRFISHSHKLSVGLLSKDFLGRNDPDAVADDLARDVSMFDQHACIAPQAYLIEGDIEEVAEFGAKVARAMETYAASCPLGRSDGTATARRRMRAVEAQFWAALSSQRRAWPGADWLVTLDDALTGASETGDRALHIVAVPTLDHALELLRPFGAQLQNVALGILDDEMPSFAAALARLGATRLCTPGRMPDPSLAWRHDGQPRISELVRWCDIEMHPWSDPPFRED